MSGNPKNNIENSRQYFFHPQNSFCFENFSYQLEPKSGHPEQTSASKKGYPEQTSAPKSGYSEQTSAPKSGHSERNMRKLILGISFIQSSGLKQLKTGLDIAYSLINLWVKILEPKNGLREKMLVPNSNLLEQNTFHWPKISLKID